jgi:hypothetical protein
MLKKSFWTNSSRVSTIRGSDIKNNQRTGVPRSQPFAAEFIFAG